MGKTNLEIACNILGWQGGTIHQVHKKTGVDVDELLESKNIEALVKAALKWNSEADEYNQWRELDGEEKKELILAFKQKSGE